MPSKKVLVIAGYVGFSLFALLVSFYLTFPADAVGQRLSHEVQKLTNGQVTMSFEDVSLYRLSGVEAEGVKARIKKEGQQPLEINVDSVTARLRLLPLLWLTLSVDAAFELGDGELDLRVSRKGEGYATALEFDDVKLQSPPLLSMLAGMPIGGTLNGTFEGDFGHKDIKQWNGKAALSLAGANLGPGTVQGFTLPAVDLGKIDLELAMDQGKLRVASFKQEGGQLHAKISGASALRPEVSSSTLDACIEFKAEPAFLEKNPKVKTALQLAEVQLKKNPQGFLDVPLGGTFIKPRLKGGLCRGGPRE